MSTVAPAEINSTDKPMPSGHYPLRRGRKPRKFCPTPFVTGCRVVMSEKGREAVKSSPNKFQPTGVVEAVINTLTLLVLVDGQKYANRWHHSYWVRA